MYEKITKQYSNGAYLPPTRVTKTWNEVRSVESKVTYTLDYYAGFPKLGGGGLPDVSDGSTHSATWNGRTLTFGTSF